MSGYLRWLAQRALGPATGVRPARRPPSLASGTSLGGEGAAAFAAAVPGDFGAAERPFDARSPEPARPARADAVPSSPRKSIEPPRTTTADDFSAAASRGQVVPEPQPDSDPGRRVQPAIGSAEDDRPLRARPEIADHKPSSDVSGSRALVPQPTTRIATRSARSRPAGDPAQPRAAAPPAPDVHIHIGRVELTAVTAAAPPRRESAVNVNKPMSLEEYLRRRSRRPS
jgi:hypothetical protein